MIKEKTSVDKIYYIGYSQGNMQMFYALAHEESYLQNNLIKLIALAPCSVADDGNKTPDGKPDADYYKNGIFKFQDEGIYSIGGPNWKHDL